MKASTVAYTLFLQILLYLQRLHAVQLVPKKYKTKPSLES